MNYRFYDLSYPGKSYIGLFYRGKKCNFQKFVSKRTENWGKDFIATIKRHALYLLHATLSNLKE